MKTSRKVKIPKFLTEPIHMNNVIRPFQRTVSGKQQLNALTWSLLLSVLSRPISYRLFLPIGAVLWVIWPQLCELFSQHFHTTIRCNTSVFNFIVAMISATCILALIAPFIKSNRITVELGISPPTGKNNLE